MPATELKLEQDAAAIASVTVPLSIPERIALFGALPKEDSFDTLRVARQLREALALSEEEQQAVNFRYEATPEPRWLWDRGITKEIDLSPGAVTLLRLGLEQLSAKKQATEIHLLLYDRLANGTHA